MPAKSGKGFRTVAAGAASSVIIQRPAHLLLALRGGRRRPGGHAEPTLVPRHTTFLKEAGGLACCGPARPSRRPFQGTAHFREPPEVLGWIGSAHDGVQTCDAGCPGTRRHVLHGAAIEANATGRDATERVQRAASGAVVNANDNQCPYSRAAALLVSAAQCAPAPAPSSGLPAAVRPVHMDRSASGQFSNLRDVRVIGQVVLSISQIF